MLVASIFKSINGEINICHQGSVCTFIRFSGCNCRCNYCDTVYAQKKLSGQELSLAQVVETVESLGRRNITITGGEPLVQKKDLEVLVKWLSANNYVISIETNGSITIPFEWDVNSWVIDYKCSSSGEKESMVFDNFMHARDDFDFIKFVIADKKDFKDAMALIKMVSKKRDASFLTWAFSPKFVGETMVCKDLMKWIENEKILQGLNVVINIQIHKIINVL